MSGKPAVVVPFESGANQRSVGTVNGRDLSAMKKQLGDLESALAQCAKDIMAKNAPAAVAVPVAAVPAPEPAKIYPILTPEVVPAPVKPLPVAPAVAPVPEGVVEDIDNVIKTIMSVIKQMTELFGAMKVSAASSGAAPACAAPAVQASPVFSRTLPGMEPKRDEKKEKAEKERAEKERKKSEKEKAKDVARAAKEKITADKLTDTDVAPGPVEPKKPEIVPPSPEMIKDAHDLLDVVVKKGLAVGTPSDLIACNEDELYCIKKFRKMILDEQEKVAQNFHKRLDKLCSKN